MRSSAVLALAILATAGPALSAPVVPPVTTTQGAPTDSSEALSLGTIGTIASLGGSVISGLIDHFKNNGQSRRELIELLARQDVDESGALDFKSIISGLLSTFLRRSDDPQARELVELLARQDVDESGALKLPSLSSIAGVASIGSALAGIAGSLFGNDNQRREFIELLARQELDESGAAAVKLPSKLPSLGSLANIASIGSSITSIVDGIISDVKGSNKARELLARQEVDESGAVKLPSLENVANIASIGSSLTNIVNGVISHFTNNKRAQDELLEMLARQDVDESGALDFKSIISGLLSSFLRRSDDMEARDLAELLARQDVDESGAASIGAILSKIFKTAGKVLVRSDDPQARELVELIARQDVDASGALDLNSIIGKIKGLLGGLLRRSDDPQARELGEILARQDVDESGALKIPSLSSIAGVASIGSALAGIAGSLFGGNDNQRRELLELLARQDVDESGALKIPSLSSIAGVASIGSALAGIAGSLFGGNDNQRRELIELLSRQDVDASEALKLPSLKNLGNIASIGLSGLGILGSLLPSDKQQQRDELVELLARSVYGRSINDLD